MPWVVQLLIVYFIQAFGNKLKLGDFVNIWNVEDRVQELNSVTCGIFQIYFYHNLFNLDENSKIWNNKRLNKRTVETLLNELFVLNDQNKNQETFKQYAKKTTLLLLKLVYIDKWLAQIKKQS